ncbi:MAG: hypothetical protein A2V90_06880 [Gammaproteobacteria bacterium RBG_16_57_12]|nr:MAG: hypothetical protein A2V90_06880 [Gammaproteobacteria bacterium RBG_16_57_12]
MTIKRVGRITIFSLTILALAGVVSCGLSYTKVNRDSPLMPLSLSEPHATVYFMRDNNYANMQLANNAVTIEINGKELASLSRGEYILARIIPTEGTVTIKSMSFVGGKPDPVTVSGSKTFNFAADQTSFIRIKMIDEEFRGTHFEPQRVEFNEARELARELRAVGKARQAPIEKL